MKAKYFEIGQIVNTVGLKGEMKIIPFTDDLDRFTELKEIYIDFKKELLLFEIEKVRFQKNLVILKLKDIDSIEEAERYKGFYIKIERKQARKLPEGTYFIADLIGMTVYEDENKKELGILEDIYNNGAQDIYVVRTKEGKQILLPATKEVIKKVDLENNEMIIHLIKGLLD